MKVKIVFAESIHYGLAAASRVMAYAKGLSENNCEVEIIMPYTFVKEDVEAFAQSGIFNGVNYSYLEFSSHNPFTKYPKGISHLIAISKTNLGYLKFFSNSIFKRNTYDIIFVYKFSTIFTWLLFLLNSGKLRVSELCEIPYHDQHGNKKKLNRRIREIVLFPLFDAVIAISKNLDDYASKHIRKNAAVLRVPILYQKTQIELRKYKPEIPYFVHSGSLSESKDGALSFLKAFGMAIQETNIPFHFYFTGYLNSSPDKKQIIEVIEQYQLKDKVEFRGFLSKSDLLKLQEGASAAIINKANNEMNFYNFPTKLAEYMFNEIAIISSKVGELGNFLTEKEDVLFFEPNDINGLKDAIVLIMKDEDLRTKLAINGRKTAEQQFAHTIQGKRLYDFFQTRLNNNK
jgi:glycosyltransferase involved in cell wall biosynthesis